MPQDNDFAVTVRDSEAEITLGLLSAVHENSAVTQRSVAGQLNIALGLANAYLKRCIDKGLIKVKQVPRNRYAYYLTPKGFTEKSRLTAKYLVTSLHFFRRARADCEFAIEQCAQRHWRNVALYGLSELGEIVTLVARDENIELVGFVDPLSDQTQFAGLPVVQAISKLAAFDGIVLTDMTSPQANYTALCNELGADKVIALRLLRVAPVPEKSRKGGRG